MVFCDSCERTAWLLDEATALLHLLHASLVLDEKSGMRPMNGKKDLGIAGSKLGGIGLLKVLIEN